MLLQLLTRILHRDWSSFFILLRPVDTRALGLQSPNPINHQSPGIKTPWNTLPPEIHDIILTFLCQDLITQYCIPCEIKAVCNCSRNNLSWPAPPQPLIDFSSARLTCRSFYHSMLRLNINGENPIHILLQAEQKNKCLSVLAQVQDLRGKLPPGHYSINIGGFMQLVGIFWKNPLICGDFEFMMSIMSVLSYKDLIMLIPHLEEWVLQHAIAKTDDIPSYVDKDVWLMGFRVHTALFQVGPLIAPGGYWSHI